MDKMESKDLSLVSNKVPLEGLPEDSSLSPYILDSQSLVVSA